MNRCISRIFRICATVGLLLSVGCNGSTESGDEQDSTDAPKAVEKPVEPWKEPLPDGAVLHLSFDLKTLCKEAGRPYAKDVTNNLGGGFIRDAEPVKGRFGTALSFDGKKSRVGGSDSRLPLGASQGSI